MKKIKGSEILGKLAIGLLGLALMIGGVFAPVLAIVFLISGSMDIVTTFIWVGLSVVAVYTGYGVIEIIKKL